MGEREQWVCEQERIAYDACVGEERDGMSEVTVTSNGHWRELVALCEMPQDAADEFDYVDEDEHCRRMPRFFVYRGVWYDSYEFVITDGYFDSVVASWDGIQTDSFFSGIVIRFAGEANDFDLEPWVWVQVGRVYA